ncbi:MAG TPA: GNAT family N-acetyltransferase [Pyrinomonadaceae bacterium]|nr:GNAT family N-acetyltransferase [Pyrinomonadaceae bacterium]
MSGYLHRAYAESLREFGAPLALERSGGWLLKRAIAQTGSYDAMGCYPLFACEDWSRLNADLQQLAGDLVSVSLVTDPFGEFDIGYLHECFPDVVKPFKQHFVIDLEPPLESFVHAHHLRNVKKALQVVQVERCVEPQQFLDDWVNLYQTLIDRYSITGIAAFSHNSFKDQLSVPGINVFRAVENGATVGMLLWYEQGDRAYYHLGAYSNRGYEVGASFALFDYALRYFCSRQLKWLNLGAGAGTSNNDSGLTRFKQGWSNGVRTAYFCGRIFARDKYQQLVANPDAHATSYFPAYRLGEFK